MIKKIENNNKGLDESQSENESENESEIKSENKSENESENKRESEIKYENKNESENKSESEIKYENENETEQKGFCNTIIKIIFWIMKLLILIELLWGICILNLLSIYQIISIKNALFDEIIGDIKANIFQEPREKMD